MRQAVQSKEIKFGGSASSAFSLYACAWHGEDEDEFEDEIFQHRASRFKLGFSMNFNNEQTKRMSLGDTDPSRSTIHDPSKAQREASTKLIEAAC